MDSNVLRVLDANCNRAREALRVIEDYARFWVDDKQLCGALKTLRHDFVDATKSFANAGIRYRDIDGDVGVDNKTSQELYRRDVADVVVAAGKRFGEAMRTLEEFSKTIEPATAAQLEKLRYRFYDLEKQLALTLRPRSRFAGVRLYVLVTASLCRMSWTETIWDAIRGGADCLQLREKTMESRELLDRAREFVRICRNGRVISIINDRPDIALLCGADGVHVGQDDLPAQEVRKLVGNDKIVGVSTHTIEQARQALRDGADYIGVGPVFKSSTKPREILPGLPFATQVARELGDKIPAVAIAGINASNVDEVLATGVRAVAVSSAVIGAADVRAAAEQLKSKLKLETDVRVSG